VLSDPRVVAALAELKVREPEAIQEQFRLTEIPAPPFKEDRRAAYFHGHSQVNDAIGWWK